ncbi:MAG: hypothetical protein ACI9P5_004746 [Saprospiraceae bacterium]|jgi:hypothetical protein
MRRIPITDKIDVKIGGYQLSLMPLSNTSFALIDEDDNRFVHCDKNDFVKNVEEGSGFTSLKQTK